jgi:hypothetical protein
MPIYKLADEMPYEELLGWLNYLERRPVDWRADDRAFKVLQTQGVKGKPWSVFKSLETIYNPPSDLKDGELNVSSLKGSALFSKMLSAKGGDNIL